MKLKLVKASIEYKAGISEMLEKWNASGEKIIPYSIRRLDFRDFNNYCQNLEIKKDLNGLVPD